MKRYSLSSKDFKKICALYNSLDLKYKKDDIKGFYNAIASVLSKDYKPYILDKNRIFAYSNKTHAKQEIYSDKKCLTFMVHVCSENEGKSARTAFDVDYEQINILTLAEGLVNLQKRLEEVTKWSDTA